MHPPIRQQPSLVEVTVCKTLILPVNQRTEEIVCDLKKDSGTLLILTVVIS